MSNEHLVIIYPGLSDGVKLIKFLTNNWERKYGLSVQVLAVPWLDRTETYEQKFTRASSLIDQYSDKFARISIIGISGGGSFAFNLLCAMPDIVNKMVNVHGRLRAGENVKPSLERASRGAPAFKDSVLQAQKNALKLNPNLAGKIMTIRSRDDEIVPISTIPLPGAQNIVTPTIEHMFSIAYTLLFPKRIIEFLRN